MFDRDEEFKRLVSRHDQSRIEEAIRRGATRRELLGMLTAAGASLGFAGGMITLAREAVAGTPKKGGSIRFAWSQHGPSDTFDPILNTNTIDYGRGRLTYNNLCRFNEDLTVRPELAEEFTSNADATEWTFRLRDGVTWHDGSKLTAEDVIYSMTRHLGAETKSKAKVLVSGVKEWVKVDARTVRAVLSAPNSELPVVLATFHFRIVKDGTSDFSKPIGTGPYKVDDFSPGVRSIHSRFDGYWGTEGGPYLDRIEVFGITDAAARVNALLTGDVDMAGTIDPKAIGQVEASDGAEMFIVPSGACNTYNIRLDMEPGNNPDFVMGMKYLQRRDRVLEAIQKGRGSIGNDHAVGAAYGADYCGDQVIRPYDLDKAKFHLKKSGITQASIDVADVAVGIMDVALLLQSEAAKAGLDLKVNRVPNDGYWSKIWLKSPLHVGSWNMRPSANIMMTIAYKSDAPWNETRFKSDRLDALLAMSRAELDAGKRKEMHCEMQKIVSDGAGSLIPSHSAYIDGKSKRLKGFPKVPLAPFGGMEWPEYAWLDA
ncbi:MAG: ABC transporter substrate-binding protein [Rhizobiales bacterium]|nr:ABC transporter substrate-binding protein [Hyphomicrobiales bacterium]